MAGEPAQLDLSDLLQASFEVSSDGMVVQTGSGEIVASNSAAERILGLTAEQLRGRTSLDPRWRSIHEDGSPFPGSTHPSMVALRTGRPVRDVIMGVHKPDGTLTWIRIEAFPLAWEGDRVQAVVVFFGDCTQERAVRDSLARSGDWLRLATRAGRVGLWDWDVRNDVVRADEALSALLGRPELAAGGSMEWWLSVVVHPDDRARALRDVLDVTRTSAALESTYRVLLHDGRVRWMLAQAEVLERDAEGPVRLAGALVDVTRLRTADAHAVELLESLPEAHFTLDDDGRFTYVNEQAEALFGRSRCQLLGRRCWEVFPEAVGTWIEMEYLRVQSCGAPVAFEVFCEPRQRWYEVKIHPLPGGLATSFRDVSERRLADARRERLLAQERHARRQGETAQAKLQRAALRDPLTGLPNRAALSAELGQALARTGEEGGVTAVCFLDIDHFKRINDTYGHLEGDAVLREAAARIVRLAGPHAFVGRRSGDEFVVVVRAPDHDEARALAGRLVAGLREPMTITGRRVVVTTSAGVAYAPPGAAARAVLRDADTALYRAKRRGRDRVVVFDEALRHDLATRTQLEADLRESLCQDLVVDYQPIFDLGTGRAVAAEALARWHHPLRGVLPPAGFLPLAEECGLLVPLAETVLATAASDSAGMFGAAGPGATTWVNTTGRQLERPDFTDRVLELCAGEGAERAALGIEVPETVLGDAEPAVIAALRRLADAGVPLAVDGFGAGRAAVAHLSACPLTLVKIDRSLVAGLGEGRSLPVVTALIELGHALGAKVCAQGVETQAQLEAVRRAGADMASGFHLARPVPAHAVRAAAGSGEHALAAVRSR